MVRREKAVSNSARDLVSSANEYEGGPRGKCTKLRSSYGRSQARDHWPAASQSLSFSAGMTRCDIESCRGICEAKSKNEPAPVTTPEDSCSWQLLQQSSPQSMCPGGRHVRSLRHGHIVPKGTEASDGQSKSHLTRIDCEQCRYSRWHTPTCPQGSCCSLGRISYWFRLRAPKGFLSQTGRSITGAETHWPRRWVWTGLE